MGMCTGGGGADRHVKERQRAHGSYKRLLDSNKLAKEEEQWSDSIGELAKWN